MKKKQANPPMSSHGWGGQRPGAGRPEKNDPRVFHVSFRLTASEYAELVRRTPDEESTNQAARRLLLEKLNEP